MTIEAEPQAPNPTKIAPPGLRDDLFAAVNRVFPTERLSRSEPLAGVWRTLFYAIGPQRPFVLRTERYRVWANPLHPKRGGDNTRALIRRGRWEGFATDIFEAHVKPGGCVIDAGANFGHYAMTAASIVGPTGAVFAFEPEPGTYALLAANVALNGYTQVRPERAGVSDTSGQLDLTVDDDSAGGHSFLAEATKKQGRTVKTPVFSLDDYMAQTAPNRRVDMIKIDVQGLELQVMEGARRILTEHKPYILCEVWPFGMAKAGTSAERLIELMDGLGYTAQAVREPVGLVPVSAATFNTVLGDGDYLDVLFARKK